MFREFSERYPHAVVILTAAFLCALYPVMQWTFLDGPPLPTVSAMAFLAASVLYSAPMIASLVLEGRLRPGAPLWRLRFVLVMGFTWFVPVAILTGKHFPSIAAATGLVGAAIYGALLLLFRTHDRWQIMAEQQFDLTRPTWSTKTGDWFLRLFPFVQWALTILVTTVEIGGTVFAVFVLILFHGPCLSYPLRKTRGRDALTALSVFCLLLGFFAGNGASF